MYYIKDTGYSYVVCKNGKEIYGTERETYEECYAIKEKLTKDNK